MFPVHPIPHFSWNRVHKILILHRISPFKNLNVPIWTLSFLGFHLYNYRQYSLKSIHEMSWVICQLRSPCPGSFKQEYTIWLPVPIKLQCFKLYCLYIAGASFRICGGWYIELQWLFRSSGSRKSPNSGLDFSEICLKSLQSLDLCQNLTHLVVDLLQESLSL
jgi:hypothetical protein